MPADPCLGCFGLGWVPHETGAIDGWATPCPACGGSGSSVVRYALLARAIGEHRTTLYRLAAGSTNGRTSMRLLRKLTAWLAKLDAIRATLPKVPRS